MFEETMSGHELLDEYLLDLTDIQARTIRFYNSDYMSRILKKHRKQQSLTLTRLFCSSRNNVYIGIIECRQTGIGTSKQWEWSSYHIGLMNTCHGLSAIAFYAQTKQAIKYTTHFFQRYKERFMEVGDWQTRGELASAKDIIEVMGIYMRRNLTMTWIETKSVFRDKVHIFGPVNDGVALLQWSKRYRLLQANTFVTMDMLDEKQTEMVEYAKIYFSLSKAQRQKYRFPDFITND